MPSPPRYLACKAPNAPKIATLCTKIVGTVSQLNHIPQEPSRLTNFDKCTLKSEVLSSGKTSINELLGRITNIFLCEYGGQQIPHSTRQKAHPELFIICTSCQV